MKKRIITPYTEIQADQINELQDYNKDNFRILIDNVVGCTTGVTHGLEPTISSGSARIVAISSGAICDGEGVFYELLNATTLTLPNFDTTYNIYAEQSQTTGGATSGYILLDIETGVEEYNIVNTLTYDSVNVSYTSGAIPASTQLLGIATVSGGVLTNISDERSFVTIGDLISNSLQGMTLDNRNFAYRANELTGTVLDETGVTTFVKVDIDDSYAGQGSRVDLGTNTGASGYVALTNTGNVGFIANGSGTGFESTTNLGIKLNVGDGLTGQITQLTNNGVSNTQYGNVIDNRSADGTAIGNRLYSSNSNSFDIAQQISNYQKGIELTNSASSTGMVIIGNGTNDYGIIINGSNRAIEITDSSDKKAIKITKNGGATVTTNIGVEVELTNAGTGLKVIRNDATADIVYGLDIRKSGTTDFTRGVSVQNATRGIYLTNNTIGIDISGNTTGASIKVLGTATGVTLESVDDKAISIIGGSVGIQVSGASTSALNIICTSTSQNGIVMSVADDAINISQEVISANSNFLMSFGANVGLTNVQKASGIYLSDLHQGIKIEDIIGDNAIEIVNSKGIVVDSTPSGSASSLGAGITVTNSGRGLYIAGTTTTSGSCHLQLDPVVYDSGVDAPPNLTPAEASSPTNAIGKIAVVSDSTSGCTMWIYTNQAGGTYAGWRKFVLSDT